MTNKTERYYVVSKSEFEAALVDAQLSALNPQDTYLRDAMEKSEAACRIREVKATFVVTSGVMKAEKAWVECLPDVTFLREDK